MLTDKQEETFQKLKAGTLNASEKADFYYRLSGILKKDLEGLKDLSRLLDEIPQSYLKKIDMRKAASAAMELTEELVKRADPVPISPKEDGGRQIFRHFKVKAPFPGIVDAVARVKVKCDATEDEIRFFNRLTDHIGNLEGIIQSSEHDLHTYSSEEFTGDFLFQRTGKRDCICELESAAGFIEEMPGVTRMVTAEERSEQLKEMRRQKEAGKEAPK